MHVSVIDLERDMSRRWSECKTAFSRCKKQQDAALAFVSKCKTSTAGVKEQYKQLTVVSSSIDRVLDKIDNVLEASQEAVMQVGRAALLIVSCPVFTEDVNSFTTLVQVIQGTRQGRSLDDLLVLVDRIIYVTIYPACDANDMAELTSAKVVAVVIQTAVVEQIQQIQTIMGHLQDETIVPSDVGIEQVPFYELITSSILFPCRK